MPDLMERNKGEGTQKLFCLELFLYTSQEELSTS